MTTYSFGSAIGGVVTNLAGIADRDRMIMVGDSLSSDIAGGLAYGIATCWFNPKGAARPPSSPEPRWTITLLEELKPLIAD